jgi:tetratricopeptide (TPR) repeat protein
VTPGAPVLDPATPPSFGEPGPVTVEPKVPAAEHGMLDHAERFGWTKDSTEFGYCVVGGGAGDTHCEFLSTNGKQERLSDFDRDAGEPNPQKTRVLNARIARHSPAGANWSFARDLVLTWQATPSLEQKGPDPSALPKERPRLRIGARVRDATRPALPVDIRAGEYAYTIHPEAVLVSPDGKHLAALSHDFGGEFSDHFELAMFETNELAAQAYNAAGLELHERGAHAQAAELFHRAAYANPSSKLPMYNLACALARLGHSGARRALELAIERGGAEVRRKAERDHDFDGVRQSDWFRELVR